MRYVGGKARIAGWVAENIAAVRGERDSYIEPFLGGGAVFEKAAPSFSVARCGDAHLDLVLMWRAVRDGWAPPTHIDRETYSALRNAEPSALRGFAGYGASFSGKWFGGYVDEAWDAHHQRMTKPYAQAASKSLVRAAPSFSDREIQHCGYAEWTPGPGDVVYCDPPYASTLGYPGSGEVFDSSRFWKTAEQWSDAGALVVVSEAQAPDGWTLLAERERKAMLRVAKGGSNQTRSERLYVLRRAASSVI